MNLNYTNENEEQSKGTKIIEITLRLKTCFLYQETTKMDNKMDIEWRVDEKKILRFTSTET